MRHITKLIMKIVMNRIGNKIRLEIMQKQLAWSRNDHNVIRPSNKISNRSIPVYRYDLKTRE